MRWLFLLSFLVIALSAHAQKTVSQVQAKEKRYCDSLMRVQYGAQFFERYFIFDSSSGGYFGNGRSTWNDTVATDSAAYFYIWYNFHFPGAKPDSSELYDFFGDAKKCPSRGEYGVKYPGNCIRVTTPQMSAIARSEFDDSLSDCTVRIYRFLDFHDSLYSSLDSFHVFLEVEHDSIKYYGINDKHYKLWRSTVVVDACNGAVVTRTKEYFRIKNWRDDHLCGAGEQ